MDLIAQPMPVETYNEQWKVLDDFIRYNPGSRHRRRIMLRMIRSLDFADCLDVGCGSGELLAVLRERWPSGKKFSGADFSSQSVELNRKKSPQMSFHLLDIQKSSLPEQFDLVICSEVIEHLEDRRLALKNLLAMVRPGGHLLLTCPTGRVYATERHFGHVSHPDEKEVDDHLAALGLEKIRAVNWGWPFYSILKWATNVNPDWALKNFASQSYTPFSKAVSIALYWINFLNPGFGPGCQLFVLSRRPKGR